MLIQHKSEGIRIMKALKIIALNPETLQTRKGALRTLTYQARATEINSSDGCVYELWFEYPSHTEENPGGLGEGVIIYFTGQLVSKGDIKDEFMHSYIHVDEFVFNMIDFEEILKREASEAFRIIAQVKEATKQDKTYKPSVPMPWGSRTKPEPEAKLEPEPKPEPPKDEESEADTVGSNSPIPDNADTSFDPEKYEQEKNDEEQPESVPIQSQTWDGEKDGQTQANG